MASTVESRAITPNFASRFTKVSAFSKSGYCHTEPFSQKEQFDAFGKVISLWSRRLPGGRWGMKVPGLKRMQTHSPSTGQSRIVARVSGPLKVRKVLPLNRVTAISKQLAATEINFPPR